MRFSRRHENPIFALYDRRAFHEGALEFDIVKREAGRLRKKILRVEVKMRPADSGS
jgi:hypothetical protein